MLNDYKLNSQQAFDIVAAHLLKQNAQSRRASGICAYRGVDGRQCAAGALMRECDYNLRMENVSIGALLIHRKMQPFGNPEEIEDFEKARKNLVNRLGDVDLRLLEALQYTHDFSQPTHWRERLCAVAQDYKLNTDVLTIKG